MNSKQQKTLERIFETLTPNNILWSDIEKLLIAIGCTVTEGNGSRVKFDYKGYTVAFHRPHPQKKLSRMMFASQKNF